MAHLPHAGDPLGRLQARPSLLEVTGARQGNCGSSHPVATPRTQPSARRPAAMAVTT